MEQVDEEYIKVSKVSYSYTDTPTLLDVSFVVQKNTLVGLVGPNGSGKTTLLKLMLGLLPLNHGQISLLGVPVQKLHSIRNQIGYVPQNTRVAKGIPVTVTEMVKMARYKIVGPLRFLTKEDQQIVDWAIGAVELTPYRNEFVGNLSDGLQQRAAIARALAKKPTLLCMDEPASSLDVSTRRLLYSLLRMLRDEHHLTQFMVSHDLQLLAEQADKLVLIDHHVIADGCPTEVLAKHQFSRLEAEFAGCKDHDHRGG